jgi:anti-sigma factor RsiW
LIQVTVVPTATVRLGGVKLKLSMPTSLSASGVDWRAFDPVVALVYGRARHVINLFVWPTTTNETVDAPATTVRGYHVQHWVRDGMTYWAVSDVAEPDLQTFASLVQNAGQPAEAVH